MSRRRLVSTTQAIYSTFHNNVNEDAARYGILSLSLNSFLSFPFLSLSLLFLLPPMNRSTHSITLDSDVLLPVNKTRPRVVDEEDKVTLPPIRLIQPYLLPPYFVISSYTYIHTTGWTK
jgi:hypothetical protein